MSADPHAQTPIPFRFERFDRLCFDGREWVYVRSMDEGHVLRRVAGDLDESFSHSEMAAKILRRDFRHDRRFFGEGNANARARAGVASLNEIPSDELPKIVHKLEYCTRFLRMEAAKEATRSDVSMEAAIREISAAMLDEAVRLTALAGQKIKLDRWPCPRTLRNWLKAFESGGHQAYALREGHRHKGNRLARLDPAVYALVSRHAEAYKNEKRPTVVKLYGDLQAELEAKNADRASNGLEPLKEPSIRALRERIRDLPAFEVHAARHGLDAACRHFNLVKAAPVVVRPGERVEMDEWTINLQKILTELGIWAKLSVLERKRFVGRRLVCVAIDVATRCILGLRIGATAQADLARETLRMVVADKSGYAAAAGAQTPWDMRAPPDLLVTDGGPAFVSDLFICVAADGEINRQVAKCKMPHLRGTIERFFGSADKGLLSYFTGRTFQSISDKGDYDGEARASLTDEDLAWALVRWTVDTYHNRPHTGLGNESPRNAWKRLGKTFGVRPPFGPDKERAVFGVNLTRDLSLRGVRFQGNHYTCPSVADLIMREGLQTVEIRVDEENLGRISVRIGSEWHAADCVDGGFDGVSTKTWHAALTELRLRYADEAKMTRPVVLEAIRAINERAAKAEAKVGILSLEPARERLDEAEARLIAGFCIAIDAAPHFGEKLGGAGADAPADLLAGAIAVGDAPAMDPFGGGLAPAAAPSQRDGRDVAEDDGYSSEEE